MRGAFTKLAAPAVVLWAAMSFTVPAHAFVVETAGDVDENPLEDLARAARWDANAGSLIGDGERGLGGGLEYAIDDSVCLRLVFVDKPSCARIHAVIWEAARRWTAGHPHLRFVNVTGEIDPLPAPPEGAWRGYGAEIDLFAVEPAQFRALHDEEVAADTRTYYMFAPRPRRFDGEALNLARGSITSADIRFNTGVCYYLDPDKARSGCMHFGSVVMHEFGHVLGLDHPDEKPARNLDLDDDPANPMRLDCTDPAKGLKASPAAERYAVANGRWAGAGYWTRGLTYDDFAGRDALYPACGVREVVAAAGGPRRWGAFAMGARGAYGWSRGYDGEARSKARAMRECARLGGQCRAAASFTDCFALARAPQGAWGWSVRVDGEFAEASAMANCARHGPGCKIETSFCAVE